MTGPTSLAELLRGSPALRRLRDQAEERRQLTERVRGLLPEPEAAHLLGARLDQLGQLVLVLDSPAWAARVRYAQAQLRSGLRPLKITSVKVQARPGS